MMCKPNMHLMLELYFHTIPAFGHCRQIQELAFEHGHQALKRVWERHNSAVRESMWNDHFQHIFDCRRDGPQNSTTQSDGYITDMISLLLGRDVRYDAEDVQAVELISCFAEEVEAALESRVHAKRKPSNLQE